MTSKSKFKKKLSSKETPLCAYLQSHHILAVNFDKLVVCENAISGSWGVFHYRLNFTILKHKANESLAIFLHGDCSLKWSGLKTKLIFQRFKNFNASMYDITGTSIFILPKNCTFNYWIIYELFFFLLLLLSLKVYIYFFVISNTDYTDTSIFLLKVELPKSSKGLKYTFDLPVSNSKCYLLWWSILEKFVSLVCVPACYIFTVDL